jgi:uncharacterized membrane protein AbrB (regulator of aidB expression)
MLGKLWGLPEGGMLGFFLATAFVCLVFARLTFVLSAWLFSRRG